MLHSFDPKVLYTILIKEVENYPKRTTPSEYVHNWKCAMWGYCSQAFCTCSDLNILLGPGLLTTDGLQHRRQRKMLNPVFALGYMRNMAPLFYNIKSKVSSDRCAPYVEFS